MDIIMIIKTSMVMVIIMVKINMNNFNLFKIHNLFNLVTFEY